MEKSMPSIAEEINAERRKGYLMGLHHARIRCIDDDGFHRSASSIQREIDFEIKRVQDGGKIPE